ncbi:MAG: hypothetical protein AAF705_22260, partial [Bacteroidota bacterium]
FYQAFRQITKIPKRLLYTLVFLMPSLLLFTSMMYKEGFLFFGLGLITYHAVQLEKAFQWRSIFGVLLGVFVFFLFREVFFLLILACLGLFFTGRILGWQSWKPYAITAITGLFLGLSADAILDQIDVLGIIATKQAAFISEVGESDFEVPYLEPNIKGFAVFLPIALQNAFLRPFLWDLTEPYFAFTGIGMIIFLLLVLIRLLFPRKGYTPGPFLTTLILFAWAVMLLVGYLVSNVGTISRYRILAVFLMIIALANATDWAKLMQRLPMLRVLIQTEQEGRNTPQKSEH